VRAVEEAWDPQAPLAEGMLELHAVCSLISSGTELKVRHGYSETSLSGYTSLYPLHWPTSLCFLRLSS
jgi:hypothetical protein